METNKDDSDNQRLFDPYSQGQVDAENAIEAAYRLNEAMDANDPSAITESQSTLNNLIGRDSNSPGEEYLSATHNPTSEDLDQADIPTVITPALDTTQEIPITNDATNEHGHTGTKSNRVLKGVKQGIDKIRASRSESRERDYIRKERFYRALGNTMLQHAFESVPTGRLPREVKNQMATRRLELVDNGTPYIPPSEHPSGFGPNNTEYHVPVEPEKLREKLIAAKGKKVIGKTQAARIGVDRLRAVFGSHYGSRSAEDESRLKKSGRLQHKHKKDYEHELKSSLKNGSIDRSEYTAGMRYLKYGVGHPPSWFEHEDVEAIKKIGEKLEKREEKVHKIADKATRRAAKYASKVRHPLTNTDAEANPTTNNAEAEPLVHNDEPETIDLEGTEESEPVIDEHTQEIVESVTKHLPELDKNWLDLQRAITDPNTTIDEIKFLRDKVNNIDEWLKKQGVESIKTKGAQFDMELHNALVVSGRGEDEVVGRIILPGYRIGNVVIRKADVEIQKISLLQSTPR